MGAVRGILGALWLTLVAGSAYAQDGGAPDADLCREAIDGMTSETSSWTASFFQSASDNDLVQAVSDRIVALKANVRRACESRTVGRPDKAEALSQLVETIDKAGVFANAMVTREQKCRADPKCVAARTQKAAADAAEATFGQDIVEPLCEATWGLESARTDIGREKANPSGVVDLVELHKAGVAAQYYQDQITALGRVYTARRHHPFKGWITEEVCVVAYDASMVERGCKRIALPNRVHKWDCAQ